MTISMIIPTFTLDNELEEMAVISALSYRTQVQELIICEDGGRYSKELAQIADMYLYTNKNQGSSFSSSCFMRI